MSRPVIPQIELDRLKADLYHEFRVKEWDPIRGPKPGSPDYHREEASWVEDKYRRRVEELETEQLLREREAALREAELYHDDPEGLVPKDTSRLLKFLYGATHPSTWRLPSFRKNRRS